LVAKELPAPRYALLVDGRRVGVFTREQLASGLDLSLRDGAPDEAQSRSITEYEQAYFRLETDEWKVRQARLAVSEVPHPATLRRRLADFVHGLLGRSDPPTPPRQLPRLPSDRAERLARLDRARRAAALPRWHHFALIGSR